MPSHQDFLVSLSGNPIEEGKTDTGDNPYPRILRVQQKGLRSIACGASTRRIARRIQRRRPGHRFRVSSTFSLGGLAAYSPSNELYPNLQEERRLL